LFWWSLAAVVIAIPFLLFGIYRWASGDAGVDREIAKDRFRAEQELKWLRRSSGNAGTSTHHNS